MRWPLIPLAFVLAFRAASGQEQLTLGGRQVVVWKPTPPASKAPVVVFSHGFRGCAKQSTFLTEALAAHGYFVVAPNHPDARCDRAGRGSASRLEEPFQNPEKWSDQTFAARRDDIRAVLQALKESPRFRDSIDLRRLALAGHSLGGYTVIGLAGGWPSWRIAGVRAVLALSPYLEPYVVHNTLGALDLPVMYQGGTLDIGITPSLRREGGAYEQTTTPKYYVELARASHFAWTNLNANAHQRILDYALPFLDRYVRGTPAGARLTTKSAGISDLRFDTATVTTGR
jgi:predicted dienelactone hydrolase